MRAAYYEQFGVLPEVRTLPDPAPPADGAVIQVAATGLCRSDWHAWKGHDPDVSLPHVGGHELAGTVVAVGGDVRQPWLGKRVTVPFICACGRCGECASGNQQVCPSQTQPGFTHWGSFAELVAIDHADVNLVELPGELGVETAASLGCRFGTAYRAVLRRGGVRAGDWVAVHGCGGVGLAAVDIAAAAGARVVAVDVAAGALELAQELGAEVTVDASAVGDTAAAVRELTGGGADVSLDCLGHRLTCAASVRGLRRRGRHVQVGLLPAGSYADAVPMELVIAHELEVVGSHGLQAHEYPRLLARIESGRLRPQRLIQRRIGLGELPAALAAMDTLASATPGLTVVSFT
ncbi:zinc-dependent alcohol dehydrogenase family protein [Flindersiella endophytica]